jgi:mutator protein MutT
MSAFDIVIVALAIVRRDGLWLVDRRADRGRPLAGLWEFPGGKIRAGETAEDAAVRECAEETSLQVEPVGRLEVVEHDYDTLRVRLHPVLCRALCGASFPRDEAVVEVRWVDDATLASLDMPAANRSIIADLLGKRMRDRGKKSATAGGFGL